MNCPKDRGERLRRGPSTEPCDLKGKSVGRRGGISQRDWEAGEGEESRASPGPREEGSYEKRNLRGCDGSSKMKIESGTELTVGTSLVTMGWQGKNLMKMNPKKNGKRDWRWVSTSLLWNCTVNRSRRRGWQLKRDARLKVRGAFLRTGEKSSMFVHWWELSSREGKSGAKEEGESWKGGEVGWRAHREELATMRGDV